MNNKFEFIFNFENFKWKSPFIIGDRDLYKTFIGEGTVNWSHWPMLERDYAARIWQRPIFSVDIPQNDNTNCRCITSLSQNQD